MEMELYWPRTIYHSANFQYEALNTDSSYICQSLTFLSSCLISLVVGTGGGLKCSDPSKSL